MGAAVGWLLFRRFSLRHWRVAPGQSALLVLILALGVGVFIAIRLANRAAVASFSNFTDTLIGQSDWIVEAPSGTLPEAILPELRAVSDAWLAEKNTGEKRFSLGFFDDRYLLYFDCAVVRRGGTIVAFANIWRGGANELSVDLMRYYGDAPKGVIDYLLIECMLWGKSQGYHWFNLGMAPLSGLEEHALAPTWHKIGRMVQRYGEMFYPFEGLRKYKEKFLPVWRPRYLGARDGLGMAGALLDVTALISGGVGKVLRK